MAVCISLLLVACWIFDTVHCSIFDQESMGLTTFPTISDSSITQITLNDNSICSVPELALDSITALEVFIMQENCLTEFPEFGKHKMTLLEIDLLMNYITYIPTEKFDGMTLLETLVVSNNPLRAIPDFRPLESPNLNIMMFILTVLEFRGTYLPPSLYELYTSGRLFDDKGGFVMSDILNTATGLETFRFRGGMMRNAMMTREDLKPFQALRQITIIKSDLDRVPDLYYQKDNIESISILDSKITRVAFPEIEALLLPRNPKITSLTLRQNLLKRLPGIIDMKKTFATVELKVCLLHCDCRVRDIIEELKANGNAFLKTSTTPCMTPISLNGIHYNALDISALTCTDSFTRDDSSGTLRVYDTFQDGARKPGPYLASLHTVTPLQCARKCRSHPLCWSFNFNEETGLCDLVGHQEVGYGNNASPGTVTYDLKDV